MKGTSLKLAMIFLMIVILCACGSVSKTMSGISSDLKGSLNREQGHRAHDQNNFSDAAESYRKAAEYGDPEAQYYLSFLYLEGKGVQKDGEAALKWMRQAADGAFAPAQVQMGLRYLSGAGVTRDQDRAFGLFLKAAESENPEAQYFVGFMSATGNGTTKNQEAALRWFRLSQSNGFPVPERFLSPNGVAALGTEKWLAKKIPATERSPKPAEKKERINTATVQAPKPAEKIEALSTAATPVPVAPSRKLIREIQAGLIRLKYNPGPADGVFGSKTKIAIKAFQSKTGLDPDGLPTQALLDRIKAE